MDTRDTSEQAELRRTARQLARELGPRTVVDLDDGKRARRLAEAVREAGWLELRQEGEAGAPLASGVEAAIIAGALGEAVADVPFAGALLAADLARRAGASPIDGAVVAFSPDLIDAAVLAARPRRRRCTPSTAPPQGQRWRTRWSRRRWVSSRLSGARRA